MKYTKALHKRLVDGIRNGVAITVLCSANRISRRTFYNWIEKGNKGEEPFASLLRDIEQADAELETELVGHLVGAARDGKWQAAATYLERRKSERWGRNNKVTVEQLENPEVVEAEALPTDELIAKYKQLEEGDADDSGEA